MTAPAFALPESWVLTSLGEFLSTRGTTVDPARQPETRFVLYSVPSFETGSPEVVYGKEVGSTKQQVDPGDVLLCKINPRINRSWVVGVHAPPTIASTEWIRFSPSGACQAAYLKLFLNQDCVKNFLAQNVSGVGGSLMRVKPSTVAPYPFPLPPSAEQARIVSRIEELFSDLDKGEENLRRAQAQLKRYRQSVLMAAVTGELTRAWRERNADTLESGEALLKRILKARRAAWEKAEMEKLRAKGKPPKDDAWKSRYVEPQGPNTEGLPELPQGWAWVSLDQLSWNSSYGTSTKCSYEGSGVGVLRIPNIRFGKISEGDIKYAIAPLELTPEELLQRGDLLIIRTNGSEDIVGSGAVVMGPLKQSFYFASYAIRFRLTAPDLLSGYMNLFLGTEVARKFIRSIKATSAGQYNVSQSNLARMPVALPPVSELPEVISMCESRISNADAIGAALAISVKQNAALRQSILKDAFSGKLVPQDPNDEPAEELLKRIAAERAAQGAGAAKRAVARPAKAAGRKARTARQAVPAASATPAPAAQATASGLAQARKAAGLSQAQLAERAGINQAYVSQMETGKRAITADQAAALALALGIEPETLR